jgi:hypothetical protein
MRQIASAPQECLAQSSFDRTNKSRISHLRLRDRLPVKQIPLRRQDPNSRIDLQKILDHVYDTTGSEDFIFAGRPDPQPTTRDAAWARKLLPPAA